MPGRVRFAVLLAAASFAVFAARAGAQPVPTTEARPIPFPEPLAIHAELFGGAVALSGHVRAESGLPWEATATLRSLPVDRLAAFLPGPAASLRGGSVSGTLTFNGFLDPAYGNGSALRIQGILLPDSLWWSQEGDLGNIQEWVLSDIDLALEMTVHGDRAKPRFSGFLEGRSGAVEYLGRRLPVSLCRVSFLDSTAFDPAVDLSAAASVVSNAGSSYRVRFDVVGPAGRARPELSSSPALSRQDIESLLALGVPLSAFSDEYVGRYEGSYWSQQVFLLKALEIGANRIVGVAETRAQSLLGLDEVRVPTARDLAGGESEMGVAKRLGGRAMVSYSSPMWHSGDYRVRLDLRLTERFSLESESDQTGDSGMDLRFKMRFR